jgi:hypothetical protein
MSVSSNALMGASFSSGLKSGSGMMMMLMCWEAQEY